jgi:CubicO group peptidase (beta-lactamase class C family)
MENTFWRHTPDKVDNTYIWHEQHKERMDKVKNGTDRIFDSVKAEHEQQIYDRVPLTGGGLTSTVNDMVRFAEMFRNFGKTESGEHIISRIAVEMITTEQLFGIPDHCWGAKEENRRYGIGFDMRRSPAFTYSLGSYMHEGAGPSAMYIAPAKDLSAVWFTPFNKNDSYAHVSYTTQNVIWSGII